MNKSLYSVVVNSEEQYSIWSCNCDPPAGWFETGFIGSKRECLNEICAFWTDIRPLSLKKVIAERATVENK